MAIRVSASCTISRHGNTALFAEMVCGWKFLGIPQKRGRHPDNLLVMHKSAAHTPDLCRSVIIKTERAARCNVYRTMFMHSRMRRKRMPRRGHDTNTASPRSRHLTQIYVVSRLLQKEGASGVLIGKYPNHYCVPTANGWTNRRLPCKGRAETNLQTA